MSWTRLLNVDSCSLSSFPLTELPPYIAVSHVWSENIFPVGADLSQKKGLQAVKNVIAECFQGVKYCWIDTCCIDQNDDEDKMRQIPLMHEIFGQAVCVAVVLNVELGLTQERIERAVSRLQGEGGALQMWRDESWSDDSYRWTTGGGRERLMDLADCMVPLTRSPWVTRVWTLQEFILARRIIWIGSDLIPLQVSEYLFTALCDICKAISITEFFEEPYSNIERHFRGMMTMRVDPSDRSRIMELLQNRRATFAVDEVFGAMAASGVTIQQRGVTTKEQAWRMWWEEAVRQGYLRWIMSPPAVEYEPSGRVPSYPLSNCIMPSFSTRHSSLGKMYFGHGKGWRDIIRVDDGVLKMPGRWAGVCRIVCKLGQVHRSMNRTYTNITLILFAAGKWERALRIARLFVRRHHIFSRSRFLAIAQLLVDNFASAKYAVARRIEHEYVMKFRRPKYGNVWLDFIHDTSSQLTFLEGGIVFLAQIVNEEYCTDIAIVANVSDLWRRQLLALDFCVLADENRNLLMIVEVSDDHLNLSARGQLSTRALHKVGMALHKFIADPPRRLRYLGFNFTDSNRHPFTIGGKDCFRCGSVPD